MTTRAPRRLGSFIKGLGVGGVASIVDFVFLAALVELGGITPKSANLPALLAGAVVQFVGFRRFVFVGSAKRSFWWQLFGFSAVTGISLALTAGAFHALVTMGFPYPLARPIAAFTVYCGFSYIAWKRVFTSQGNAGI